MAQMHGAVLHEIGMSPDTDNSDIIGCFEQAELQRSARTALSRLQTCVDTACARVITSLSSLDSTCWSDWLAACSAASSELFNITSTLFSNSKTLALAPPQILAAGIIGRCRALIEQVQQPHNPSISVLVSRNHTQHYHMSLTHASSAAVSLARLTLQLSMPLTVSMPLFLMLLWRLSAV